MKGRAVNSGIRCLRLSHEARYEMSRTFFSRFFLSIALLILFGGKLHCQKYELFSPDKRIKAVVETGKSLNVFLYREGQLQIRLQNISLNTGNEKPGESYDVRKTATRTQNRVIRPQIREKSESIVESYNELEIKFRGIKSVTFRLTDEGLAYRFATGSKDSLFILSEHLDIMTSPGDSARFLSSPTFNSCWETPYEHSAVGSIDNGKLCTTPFLIEKKGGGYVMITESDLYNYPGLWIKGTGEDRLAAVNPPYPRTLRYTGSIFDHGQVADTRDYIARVGGTRTYPWRIFGIARDEAGLITNNMVYLLASPPVINDVSWIKPGVVMFDWWGKFNIYGVDFRSGINTATAKYFIDCCAANGFRYFMFDDGWCPEEDLLSPRPELNMKEVTAYAASKGVDIILWVLWHSLEKQWDNAFRQFSDWGIKGIKIDFMNRDDQPMVEFYEAAAKKAAEYKMVVDFHGAYKPCGLGRKYPNVLTREALIEFEYNGWTQYDTPEHHNLLPYIRMFAGAMDYIPATMRNSTRTNFRAISDYPMGQGTRAHSMALWIILNSPLTMLPDSPSDYYREKECTGFIAGLPVVWDETRLLQGKIARYTVIARRSGREWYIGAITDWSSREIDLDTSFLPSGEYKLEGIADGVNAGSRAEDYISVRRLFRAGEKLGLSLAPGGGYIAKIVPVE